MDSAELSTLALVWIAYFAGYAMGSGEHFGPMGYVFMGGAVVLIGLRFWSSREPVVSAGNAIEQ